ncbi:sushi, von Willebrand factor type A, EGF and pentraxin domain-containing protein 1-like [Orbicella faveolata]|uniref:sushi, von Willebrand factor type A, EGF and pentraxin domain-containing protein 1-like n=1 Tax=Orbicella faveolata TaxID=48498 RepID=UPI0009E2AB51|nr:sushi, von Willebrand factor type A, EGF and pentraxin domain-containing protein 1-like [Orbicella faveolata]
MMHKFLFIFTSVKDYTCPDLQAPLNGAKACETWLKGMFCTVHCNEGFGFVVQPEALYVCSPKGIWINAGKETPSLPDCSKTHMPKEAVVNGDVHYLADKCGGESVNEVIAGNFINLFRNSPFGMAGGCNGKCTIDNVGVECGNQTEARRRRDAPDGKQASKISLTVHFSLKVPLPSNASLFDLNQTSQQISNNLLEALNETDLTLNINGVIIVYDSSKPPVFRLTSLVCSEGQVQRGPRCVNCPLGYFFNTSGCQACAVDEYQDQEAQTSCLSCPSGTTTFGQTASKSRKNCQEIPSPSSTEKQGFSKPILYTIIGGIGAGIFIGLIGITIFCAKKHCVAGKTMSRKERRTYPYPVDDDMGRSNPTYVGSETTQTKDPFPVEMCEL